MTPANPATFVDILTWRSSQQPEQNAYTFLSDGEQEETRITYRELEHRARAIGGLLQSLGASGECVLLLYPPGLDFIAAFFGCMYAGAIAVPAYPPRNKRHLPRLQMIIEDARSNLSLALTTERTKARIQNWFAENPVLKSTQVIPTDHVGDEYKESWKEPDSTRDTLAFLQYTSGSTARPKGVMVSHGNVLNNSALIQRCFGHSPESRGVIWLPPYHDMGLIGGILQPLFVGFPVVLMSPMAFLQRPVRWLEAISRYHATTSGGPDFAYELCARKTTDEQRKQLDLSNWELAFNGAEPLHPATLEHFALIFESCGFRREAFYPCYGLAEATLIVSGGEKDEPPITHTFQESAIERHQVVEVGEDEEGSKRFVGCGQSLVGHNIVIVNPETLSRASSGEIGEIWVCGPSIAQGYWKRKEETEKSFQAYLSDTGEGPFLRTGDLGFLKDDELYVTGRLKDLIIIRGSNYYPQDIERIVEESHPTVRANASAAFSLDIDGEERLIIVAEVERRSGRKLQQTPESEKTEYRSHASDYEEVVAQIRQAVTEYYEIQVYAVVLIRFMSIPKTSSGKIQRHACRAGFLDGTLDVVTEWIEESMKTAFLPQSHDDTQKHVPPLEQRKTVQKTSEKADVIQDWLINHLAKRVNVNPQTIDVREPFARYGLDSVQAVDLSAELEDWLDCKLSPTLVYDYPNIALLSRYLAVHSEISDLSEKIRTARKTETETIAVIGIGCRFPGADNPQQFWELLKNGIDGITEVPLERWNIEEVYDPTPATPGKMNTRWGGFLRDVGEFDAQFFGISPREAENMDPQQRLLLQVAWESLEHSGHAPDQIAGSHTGVFIGISGYDYSRFQGGLPTRLNAYSGTGNALCIAANRLSYILDLRGPSLAIDTACSSSLVAVHQACLSLHHDECDLALAGGVNLILSPEMTISLSQTRLMAADGRCKTFDSSADGYVRGEGCGVVVLKRLSDALKDGDNILALIRGSAVNQDGRSNGLTAPNGFAQQTVINQALQNAGVAPYQISYFEAHGTGTPLGDPIEVNALKEVLMAGRSFEHPCWIGSVKTNIGHLESAAGIAGLIKVILALQHETIPPHLHLKQLNPHISLDGTPFSIPTGLQPWDVGKDRRLAGISSFGFGGTNAHLVVEETLAKARTTPEIERSSHILAISARHEDALTELAQRYESFLKTETYSSLPDICFTANAGRTHFDHRLAAIADTKEQLREQLGAFVDGKKPASIVTERITRGKRHKIALLFTGQGSQYIGMGRQLYDTQPTFRRILDHCAEILRPYLEISLLSVLYPEKSGGPNTNDQTSLIHQTAYTQPAIFAVEYALARLLLSWGIEPDAVIGHSIGEYAAVCVAGVLQLEDALKLVAERGRLMQQLPQNGGMVAVRAGESHVAQLISPYTQDLSIAAVNSPNSVVISGTYNAIESVTAELQSEGISCTPLTVSHAFHSPLMQPILADFERVAQEATFAFPGYDVISCVTGEIEHDTIRTADYWRDHIRNPVRFAAGMETLFKEGYDIFFEVGAKPIVSSLGRQCLEHSAHSPPQSPILWLPALRQGRSDWQQLLQSLGELYVHGVPIDWAGFDLDYLRRRIPLPTYPFQQQHYWLPTPSQRAITQHQVPPGSHPLLGRRLHSALHQNEIQFESQMSQKFPTFLKHHQVFQQVIPPTAVFLEMALAATTSVFESEILVIDSFMIQQALLLGEHEEKTVQIILCPDEMGSEKNRTYSFQIFSLFDLNEKEKPSWILHASGTISAMTSRQHEFTDIHISSIQDRCHREISVEALYQKYQERGIVYGTSFQGITQLWKNQEEALGFIHVPQEILAEMDTYTFHPALLDAAMQVVGGGLFDSDKQDSYLPVSIERFTCYQHPTPSVWSHVQFDVDMNVEQAMLTIPHMRFYTPEGKFIASMEGLVIKKASRGAMLRSHEIWQDWLYEIEWLSQNISEYPQTTAYLPQPQHMKESIGSWITEFISDADLQNYQEALTWLETLSADYVLNAFWELGWEFRIDSHFSLQEFLAQTEIIPLYHTFAERLLGMLEEEGWLKHAEDGLWEVATVPRMYAPQDQIRELIDQYPLAESEFLLLGHCGTYLSRILQGESEFLHIMTPEGDVTELPSLYQEAPERQALNTLIQRIFKETREHLPKKHTLRIVEIGGATGGMTAPLLSFLSQLQKIEYVFTSVSHQRLEAVRKEFQTYPFVQYQVLDIEQSPQTQHLDVESFDMILASNTLHETCKIRSSLTHVKALLRPGGLLVLLERLTPLRWVELVFGLTEAWWKFNDVELRHSHPLLSGSQWQTVLQESGFQDVQVFSPAEDAFHQAVIVAQTPQADGEGMHFLPENWIIFADSQGVGQQLATLLEAQNYDCSLVFIGNEYEQVSEHEFKMHPESLLDFETLLAQVQGKQQAVEHIVHLWSLDTDEPHPLTVQNVSETVRKNCGSVLYLVQTLLKRWPDKLPFLWLVTQNAQAIGRETHQFAINQAPLWGIGGVISLEHPELWGGMIDLSSDDTAHHAAALLLNEIKDAQQEDHISFREQERYVARLVRSPYQSWKPFYIEPDGAYLITGGLGFLGIHVARWLVEKGAKHLILTGRRGLSEYPDSSEKTQAIQSMENMGAEIFIRQADVSNLEHMTHIFQWMNTLHVPLKGIIHAAGMLEHHRFEDIDIDSFLSILYPKVQGGWILHQLTLTMKLDFFVLFSSASSIWGSKGQVHYAAANSFLDSLAHYRRSLALPALSINWGVFPGSNLVGEEYRELVQKMGMHDMPIEAAFDAMDYLLAIDSTQTTVANIDWTVFKEIYETRQKRPLLETVGEEESTSSEHTSEQPSKLLQQLHTAAGSEQQQLLAMYIQDTVAKSMGLRSSELNIHQPLNMMGLDSLMAVELRNQIRDDLSVDIPMVKFMEGITLQTLEKEVLTLLAESESHHELSSPVALIQETIQEEQSVSVDIEQDIEPEDAGQLLMHIDKLSEEEIEKLLGKMLSETEEPHD